MTDTHVNSITTYGVAPRASRSTTQRERPAWAVPPRTRQPNVVRAAAALAVLVVAVVAGAVLVDTSAGSWYARLRRPSWTEAAPTVLGAGWLVASAGIVAAASAVSAGVRRRAGVRTATVACAAWMAVALVWMWLVFVRAALDVALAASIVLVVSAMVALVGVGRVSRAAAFLVVPAAAWSALVPVLTGGLVVLN